MTRSEKAKMISKIAGCVSKHPSIEFATLYIGEEGRLLLGVYYTVALSVGELTDIVTKAGGPMLSEVLRHDPNLRAKRIAPRVDLRKGWF